MVPKLFDYGTAGDVVTRLASRPPVGSRLFQRGRSPLTVGRSCPPKERNRSFPSLRRRSHRLREAHSRRSTSAHSRPETRGSPRGSSTVHCCAAFDKAGGFSAVRSQPRSAENSAPIDLEDPTVFKIKILKVRDGRIVIHQCSRVTDARCHLRSARGPSNTPQTFWNAPRNSGFCDSSG